MENDPDDEEMNDVNINDYRERHWRMVLEDNDGGVYNAKALLHSKRWYVSVNENEKLFKGGYLVEVGGHDRKKVIWEVVKNHVVEEPDYYDEIGLRVFISICSTKTRGG